MAIEKINIDQFLQLSKHLPVIDVRSPGEYKHAHLPGAYSLPLFTDEERAAVGTAYKQESREKAIKIGLNFLGPKMKRMIEEVEGLMEIRDKGLEIDTITNHNSPTPIPNSKLLLIYCWRGGMRSAAVAWLLDMYGFKVYTLAGGYKKFRNHVLGVFKEPLQLKILGGFTGSGKTETLKELERYGEKIIDLEEIACHKGSAFGNIGMPVQPSQEMFENTLATKLFEVGSRKSEIENEFLNQTFHFRPLTSAIWLEDESQRIGLINIPTDLWNNMRQSPVYFLDIPFEERLNHLVEEYGSLEKQKMIEAIDRIRTRLGGFEAKNAITYLQEDNTIESFRILLKYYDKWYQKGLHNREELNSLLHTINCESVTPLNAKKLIQQSVYHEKS
jgi:tRNA 2-selenouridine synthase